jgi:transposase InsO family protein
MAPLCAEFGISRKTCCRSFSRIFGAPQPGYSRFSRTVVASSAHHSTFGSSGWESAVPVARRYCYRLTITDVASRYLLTCEALATTQEKIAFTVFERTFTTFGLPQCIRTDDGVPFAAGEPRVRVADVPAAHGGAAGAVGRVRGRDGRPGGMRTVLSTRRAPCMDGHMWGPSSRAWRGRTRAEHRIDGAHALRSRPALTVAAQPG